MNVSDGESSEIISASGNSEHRFSCRSEPQSNTLLLILVFLLYLLVVYFKKKKKQEKCYDSFFFCSDVEM